MKRHALELVQVIADALVDAVGDGITVTASPRDAAACISSGLPVVLVNPPDIEHQGRHLRVLEWNIVAIGSTRDADDAWDELDELLDIIADAVDAERSSYGTYQPPHGDPWPCVVIETTTTHRE